VDTILVRMAPGSDPRRAPALIKGFFAAHTPNKPVTVNTAEELIAQMEKQMKIFTLMLGAIGSISLIVGGVGVMNVMLVSVTERKNEIGVRRAFGAQRVDIQAQFLVEALILCLMGGALGALFGTTSAYIIAQYSHWHFFMSRLALFLGIVVSCAIGIFFGFYPAFQASRLKIIQALRNE
jgi:putative ABC transport system permease protein